MLVVDDDPTVAEVVVTYLERAGLHAVHAEDGASALSAFAAASPDLVVLDLMLPDLDGLEVCRRLRATSDVPVIMLTALGDEVDRVLGLEVGADDYVTKPFSPRELVLRVQSVLRRAARDSETSARHTPRTRCSATATSSSTPQRTPPSAAGEPLPLTSREFDLLAFLLANTGRAFTRAELMEQVWGWSFGDQSTVTVHVRRLREKVEPDAHGPVPPDDGVGRRLPLGPERGARREPLGRGDASPPWSAAPSSVPSGSVRLHLLGRRSARTLAWLAPVTAVVAVVVGVVATAQRMFLSSHDLGVVLVVCAAAGCRRGRAPGWSWPDASTRSSSTRASSPRTRRAPRRPSGPAASWWPGSRTTCGRRWPACGR